MAGAALLAVRPYPPTMPRLFVYRNPAPGPAGASIPTPAPGGWGIRMASGARPSVMNARRGGFEGGPRRASNRGGYAIAGSNMLWMGTLRPSGSNSPVSSKMTTPLHSRPHPCSG